MPNQSRLTALNANPWMWLVVILVLALVAAAFLMLGQPIPTLEMGDTGAYVPVKMTPDPTEPSAGETLSTKSVSATQLDNEVESTTDLDSSLSDLDSVDVDYIDALLNENDSDATRF
jgi:hypothetical protein